MFEFEPAMEMFFIAVKARDLIYGEIFYLKFINLVFSIETFSLLP